MQALRVFLLLPDGDVYQNVNAVLQEPEFECVWCRCAADALIVLGHRRFDLVISQAQLPDMSGMELVATLDAEGIDLPAVLLMGPEDTRLPPVAGGQVRDIVPLSEDFAAHLPDRVRNAVAKHQLEQANRIYIAALESARDGIAIADLQGVVLHVNRCSRTLLASVATNWLAVRRKSSAPANKPRSCARAFGWPSCSAPAGRAS